MSGLKPDTVYQYRLQGVGSDGNIYRSETMTFTTPDGQETADFGQNVALAATVVDVSSEFSDSFVGANAVDGDLGTEWSSRGDGDDAFITIDLGQSIEVSALVFRTRSMSDGTATTETYIVEAGEQQFGPFAAGVTPVAVDFVAQVLTFTVDSSTGGNTGAVEIEVYSSQG